jgi:hypothetical protein
MRLAKWVCGAVWAGSWYLMYLEITRWRHVKPSLAFNADPVPGSGIKPCPGLPLILLYFACVAFPLTVMAALAGQARERRAGRLAVAASPDGLNRVALGSLISRSPGVPILANWNSR